MDKILGSVFDVGIKAVEMGLVPDSVVRHGIRFLLSERIREVRAFAVFFAVSVLHPPVPSLQETKGGEEAQAARKQAFVEQLKAMPVAINTQDALDQHYEVPTEYFLRCLGRRLKYSSCLYPSPSTTLEEARGAASFLPSLSSRCQLFPRAGRGGHAGPLLRSREAGGRHAAPGAGLRLGLPVPLPRRKVPEVRGWSPPIRPDPLAPTQAPQSSNRRIACRSHVTAVSHSRTQKDFIDTQARLRKVRNLTVITANMVDFEPPERGAYDRVLSIEMFEHVRGGKASAAESALAVT